MLAKCQYIWTIWKHGTRGAKLMLKANIFYEGCFEFRGSGENTSAGQALKQTSKIAHIRKTHCKNLMPNAFRWSWGVRAMRTLETPRSTQKMRRLWCLKTAFWGRTEPTLDLKPYASLGQLPEEVLREFSLPVKQGVIAFNLYGHYDIHFSWLSLFHWLDWRYRLPGHVGDVCASSETLVHSSWMHFIVLFQVQLLISLLASKGSVRTSLC